MGDALRELGYELRQSVDKVSPKTRMGLCVEADFERDGEAVIDFARAIAGGGRPFVCYATALRGAKARTNSSLDCPVGLALWGYRWLPPDFEICYEFGFEPRSRRLPVCRMDEAMHILHVALGADDLFLRVSNDEGLCLEGQGRLEAFARAEPRMSALKKAMKGTYPRGVQLLYRHSQDDALRYPELPTLNEGSDALSCCGVPFCVTDVPVKMLIGVDAERFSDADLKRLMGRGVLLDGEAAKIICRRGYAEQIGADVGPDGICNLRRGAEVLVKGRGANFPCPEMYRYKNNRGGRIAVVSDAIMENTFTLDGICRNRKIVTETFRWLAGDDAPLSIWANVKDASNVMVVVQTPNQESFMLLAVANMGANRLEDVELEIDPWYRDGEIEELAENGDWRHGTFLGAYDAGQVRIFRIRKKGLTQ